MVVDLSVHKHIYDHGYVSLVFNKVWSWSKASMSIGIISKIMPAQLELLNLVS